MLPRSWEKLFKNGIVKPAIKRRCDKCRGEILRATCDDQINQNKEFEANLSLLKREVANEFGCVPPYLIFDKLSK